MSSIKIDGPLDRLSKGLHIGSVKYDRRVGDYISPNGLYRVEGWFTADELEKLAEAMREEIREAEPVKPIPGLPMPELPSIRKEKLPDGSVANVKAAFDAVADECNCPQCDALREAVDTESDPDLVFRLIEREGRRIVEESFIPYPPTRPHESLVWAMFLAVQIPSLSARSNVSDLVRVSDRILDEWRARWPEETK